MTDRLKLPLQFDAREMRADVARLERDAWIAHYVTQNYEGAWTVLPFRAPSGAGHAIETIYSDPAADNFVDTPLLDQCAYFPRVLAAFQCPLLAVRLMKLAPGSVIKPHRDHDLGARFGNARLHVPVATNPGVEFWLNDTRVVLDEGECWYLDLSMTHWVANRGESDRIHLVLDVVVNAWLEDQMAAARPSRVETAAPPVRSGLQQFIAAVQEDVALQHRLRAVDDRAAFIALVIEAAAERGLSTTAGEIDGAMRDTRRRARWR